MKFSTIICENKFEMDGMKGELAKHTVWNKVNLTIGLNNHIGKRLAKTIV